MTRHRGAERSRQAAILAAAEVCRKLANEYRAEAARARVDAEEKKRGGWATYAARAAGADEAERRILRLIGMAPPAPEKI